MYRFCQFLLLGLLAASLAGCGSLQKQRLAAPKESQKVAVAPRAKKTSDRPASLAAAHARYAAAVIEEINGDAEAALEDFYQSAWEDPGNEWLMLEVSRRFVHQRKLDKAVLLLERAAAQPEVTGPVLARLAMVYSQLGRVDESLKASRAAIRKAPATLAAYQSIFVNFMQARKYDEALAALDAAGKVNNPTPEFLIGLSELYVTYGMQVATEKTASNTKALAALKRAQKLAPSDPLFKLKLADGFSLLGEQEAAAELYTELLANASSLPLLLENVHAKLANIYLRSSNREKAAEQLQALVKADPTNPQPYYFLGHLAFDQQKIPEAAEFFSKTILLSPDFEQAYYELANAQLAMDKAPDALATLEKARGKFAAGFAMEFFSAVASARLKDYERALRHFTAAEVIANATDTNRLNHIFYFQLGVAYEQKKDYEQAADAFKKCLEKSPDFTDAMNYLGYMWADQNTNLNEAVVLLEKAVKLEPKNAAYLDSLGWVYYRLNRLSEALENVRKAVELTKEPDAVLFEHLGDIYAALGRNAEAREAWQKSLDLEPKDSLKTKLEGLAAKP